MDPSVSGASKIFLLVQTWALLVSNSLSPSFILNGCYTPTKRAKAYNFKRILFVMTILDHFC